MGFIKIWGEGGRRKNQKNPAVKERNKGRKIKKEKRKKTTLCKAGKKTEK